MKIMQIDDDIINNMANERLLKKMNLEVESINFLDPTEALQHLSTQDIGYDFILLDINMPRLSGWEFLDKYEPFCKNIPIIMLTSSLDPNDQKKAKASKLLSGFYIKPLTKESIEDILTKVMPNLKTA
jgi:CheY-like chemotaxis protein